MKLFKLLVLLALFSPLSARADGDYWPRFVALVTGLAQPDSLPNPELTAEVHALLADPEAIRTIKKVLFDKTNPWRVIPVASPLAKVLKATVGEDERAGLVVATGFPLLQDELGLIFDLSNTDALDAWEAVPPELIQIKEAQTKESRQYSVFKANLVRVRTRLFIYLAALSGATLWALNEHFPGMVPSISNFWDLSKTNQFIANSGLFALKNLVIFTTAWKMFLKTWAGKHLAAPNYDLLVSSLEELILVSPQETVPYLARTASAKKREVRLLEDATLEAFFRTLHLPESRAVLAGLAIHDVELGHIDRAMETLQRLSAVAAPDDPIVQMSRQVQRVHIAKKRLEEKLNSLRTRYVIKNVALVSASVTALLVAGRALDPDWVTRMKIVASQIVAIVGSPFLLRQLWHIHPEKAEKSVALEMEEFISALSELLETGSRINLEIVSKIAIPDDHTHPLVQAAAIRAMSRSRHPRVINQFKLVAGSNLDGRGIAGATDEFFGHYYDGNLGCIVALQETVLERQRAAALSPPAEAHE